MASLIPGYEYDIFISYRQKDNKGDKWVSEFVEALKTELESTFKDEVSVYFDINPHDGLLETHDVDASLKEKLKCAVFIPIISRTYCDPKSFAWVHEFKAFIEQASKDQYGLKIKLPHGNISNRVLPVQIHDLDPEDKKLVEDELGGFIRGIDFIYKEPGVNRPLTPIDDEKKNLSGTVYRNQVNKVANAVKEIISGLKHPEHSNKEVQGRNVDIASSRNIKNRAKKAAAAFFLLVLIAAGYYLVPQLTGKKDKIEKSIAVLIFHNFSSDTDQESMSYALTDEIISNLFKIKSFDKIVPLNSVLVYKGTGKGTPQIARELNVNYIIEGTYKKIGDSVTVTVNLIEAWRDKIIWQDKYRKLYSDIFAIQANIPIRIAENLKAFLTSSERQKIEKKSTANLVAYKLVQDALYQYYLTGMPPITAEMIEVYKKAIELDPDYADAQALVGFTTLALGAFAGTKDVITTSLEAEPFVDKALHLDPDNAWGHVTKGAIYEWARHDFVEAEKEYLKCKKVDPNVFETDWFFYSLGEFYLKMNRPNDAIANLNKCHYTSSLTVINPHGILVRIKYLTGSQMEAKALINNYFPKSARERSEHWLGELFIWISEYDSALVYLESAAKYKNIFMQVPRFQACLALAYSKTGKKESADSIIKILKEVDKTSIAGSPEYFTGWYYSGTGEADSAFRWLEKAYRTGSPEFSWLKVDPVFKNLKGDRRYRDLYEKTGHKAYDEYKKNQKK